MSSSQQQPRRPCSRTAFASPVCVGASVLDGPRSGLTSRFASQSAHPATAVRPRRARLTGPVMDASPEDEETVSLTDKKTDAAAILKAMRMQVAAEAGPRTLNTGVTRDQDGKSNVWAVEPTEKVDDRPPVNKAAILGAVFAAVAIALLLLPKLPLLNADQF